MLPNRLDASTGQPQRTFLLCGGGTGGHVYPALAVAEALLGGQAPAAGTARPVPATPVSASVAVAERNLGSSVRVPPNQEGESLVDLRAAPLVYVGSEDGMERGLVARESQLPFYPIPAAAIRGRGPIALLRSVVTIVRGTWAARQLLREVQPAAILGTGGYVCVPLFLAARAARVPTMIYLPDVVPGLAVRLLARLATVIACNVEDSRNYLQFVRSDLGWRADHPTDLSRKQRVAVVGYPTRSELYHQSAERCREVFGLQATLPVLLVYGGSRGARSINRAIEALLPNLLEQAQLIHVCGREGDEQFLRDAAAKLPTEMQARYHLFPYLHSGSDDPMAQSMVRAFGAADLAICRSGASTLAELPAAGLPAVLVPYPYVHQDENAAYLVERGAAVTVADTAMLGQGRPEDGQLFQQVQHLLTNQEKRTMMQEHMRALAQPDAAGRLVQLLTLLAARRGQNEY